MLRHSALAALLALLALLGTSTGCSDCDLALYYSVRATFSFEDIPPEDATELNVSYRESGDDTWHACNTPRVTNPNDVGDIAHAFETHCAEEVSGDLDIRVIYREQTLERSVHVSADECHVSPEYVTFHLD